MVIFRVFPLALQAALSQIMLVFHCQFKDAEPRQATPKMDHLQSCFKSVPDRLQVCSGDILLITASPLLPRYDTQLMSKGNVSPSTPPRITYWVYHLCTQHVKARYFTRI